MQESKPIRGGIWEESFHPVTGESSLKEHKLKTVWESCAKPEDHYFTVPNPKVREAVCDKCGMFKRFILGKHIVKDGKVVHL